MKQTLTQLFELKTFTENEAYELMLSIGKGELNDAHLASLLTVFMMRPVTIGELKGFRQALLELCVPFETDREVTDVCGTGGDGKNTFNISTLTAVCLAACGHRVVKHGNYGVSSASGSSNVMEYFGYKFTNDPDTLHRQLEEANICFLHGPLFHPALKHVAGVRKQLGIKTFFNMLGPLVNPAQPKYRLAGVFSLELARMYHYLLQQSDCSYAVVHSLDGYDEISLTGNARCYTSYTEIMLTPADFGTEQVAQEDLFGGDTVEEAAAIFKQILEGKGTAVQNRAVAANTALAMRCREPEKNIADCMAETEETLLSGKALQTFKKLVA